MARGGHGLPKLSLGPAIPYSSKPCRKTTPETALRPFQEWPVHRVGGPWPSSTLLNILRRRPMVTVSVAADGEAERDT
jgi:hypothetical protein